MTITIKSAVVLGSALVMQLELSAQESIRGWGTAAFDTSVQGHTITQVAAGGLHSLALSASGSLIAWGDNLSLQCVVPSPGPGLSYVKSDAGQYPYMAFGNRPGFCVAVRSDGSLAAWGSNSVGQLNLPLPPPSGTVYVEVEAGTFHSAALRSDGIIDCFGNNGHGQLNVPPLPPGLTYIEVSAGFNHTVAIRSNGSAIGWGNNDNGQIDIPVLPPGKSWVHMSAGGGGLSTSGFTAGLNSDGIISVWGSGPTDVPALPAGMTYVDLHAGHFHAVALRSDGAAVAWGDNSGGQLSIPTLPAGETFIDAAAGLSHTVLLTSAGRVVCVGSNSNYQCNAPMLPANVKFVEADAGTDFVLGLANDGLIYPFGFPHPSGNFNVPTLPGTETYTRVIAQGYLCAALRSDGHLVPWGDSSGGTHNVPALPSGTSYIDASAGTSHMVALRSDGQAFDWGTNAGSVPALPSGLTYVQVAAGSDFSLGRRSDGSVVAWGISNAFGQLNVPALPAGLTFVEIAAGDVHALARRSDGTVVAWGGNNEGQSTVPSLPGAVVFTEIAAKRFHSLGRTSTGEVVGWGKWGANGTVESLLTNYVPVVPPGLVYIKAGVGSSLAIALVGPAPACGSVSPYCAPAAANTAHLEGSVFVANGCPGIAANNLVLEATSLPPNTFGMFLYGPGNAQVQLPFGNGWNCLGGIQQRIPPILLSSLAGAVSLPLDLTLPPFSAGSHAIIAGSTWNFQFIYRDPTAVPTTFNLSNALHLVFAP